MKTLLLLAASLLAALAASAATYPNKFVTNATPENVAWTNTVKIQTTGPLVATSNAVVGASVLGNSNTFEVVTAGGVKAFQVGTNGIVSGNFSASYIPFQLYGTNIVLSPTNGNLQALTLTNATYITLAADFTNRVESIRLDLSGTNSITVTAGNISNATVVATSGKRSAFLFDKSAAVAVENPGGTNWYVNKLYSY